uniref:serine O-acetyltransferase n=1 Tax=Chlamydomonas leiostraca TaxID=1034604 RepID=A0A7S0WPA3_9CHLO|mmetsp:Transcript_21149/g.53747  ORF Transcript_21149/g.53747 Transcript_21149/m.53747 type:complete len:393 (+) Transcript_21149:157-1335(+)
MFRSLATQLDVGLPSTSAPAPRRSSRQASGRPRTQFGHQRQPWSPVQTMAPDKSHLAQRLERNFAASVETDSVTIGPAPELRQLRSPRPFAICDPPAHVPPPERSLDDDNEEYHPSDGWRARPHHLSRHALWQRIRDEAAEDAALEPRLATFLHAVVLSHGSMCSALSALLANKLGDGQLAGPVQLMSLLRDAYRAEPELLGAACADLQSVLDRDPACTRYSQCMLYFKGYQAVQAYRVSHWLWGRGRRSLALALASRVNEVFGVDIHPGARLGWGLLLDHATGVVIGETAVVGDNVSMLHRVALGGSGTVRGHARHPQVGHGVLLGAGVTVLGAVNIGPGSKVGAGSLVISDLPPHCVAVGVPAAVIKRDMRDEPVADMDQCADFILDYVI